MKNLLNNAISNELFFVYGLIALVVILIIVIVLLDKKESKKRNQNLFDTLNMKIIADPYEIMEENKRKEETEEKVPEIIEIETSKKIDDFKDLEPIPEINMVEESLNDIVKSIDEEVYVETELEKTQAQIRIEEITKALEEAEIEEKIEKDKYEQFEEEQEKNAIISYNELKKSFDKLYSENEKIQYLDDDEIPINIEELYKMQNEEQEKNNKKVALEDFITLKETNEISIKENSESTFKSSPYISPVYGIQKPPIEVKKETDAEIESANNFLQTLKELKNNLD